MYPTAPSTSWKATTWISTRTSQNSLKKTIQAYKSLATRLKTKLDQLTLKKEDLDSRAFVVLEENNSMEGSGLTPTSPCTSDGGKGSSSNGASLESRVVKVEENEYYHPDVSSLVSTATNILIQSVELRLSYVTEALGHLMLLYRENPKLRTPPELMFSRYEQWVQTNQRLCELNSRLYDLEKVKFDIRRREALNKQPIQTSDRDAIESVGSQLVQSNAMRIQSLLSRYQFSSTTTQAYLQEVLSQRGEKPTLEAQKVQEYVNECIQNSRADLKIVVGAHPQNYQQFMAVLCSFIVERQREIQGEHIPHTMVYNVVEHVIVPQVQSLLLRYVQQEEKDARIKQQCLRYSDITMDQLHVKPAYQSPELEPFIDSISQLRATYFSPTPTDKMSGVVAAAKSLYDQLNMMGETSIDGDSFLDLWIYVIIKANVPNLATNVGYMTEYGNPSLGMDEAGYYLTTLGIAANFIENLDDHKLKKPSGPECFVVCEREKYQQLSEVTGSCFKVVSAREELRGFKIAVIKEWVLNKARLFCSVLLPTGNPEDIALVSVIRLSSESSSHTNVEYFTKKLTNPDSDLAGLKSLTTPLGGAITLDLEEIDENSYFILKDGNFDTIWSQIDHIFHLIRLGSESTERSYDPTEHNMAEDKDFIYVFNYDSPSDFEESSTGHRPLSQKPPSFCDSDSEDSITDSPAAPAKGRSKSFTSSLTQPVNKDSISSPPFSSISHSPYLLTYSPRRNIRLNTLPPNSPPEDEVQGQVDKSNTNHGGWRFLRPFSAKATTTEHAQHHTPKNADLKREKVEIAQHSNVNIPPELKLTNASPSDKDVMPTSKPTKKEDGCHVTIQVDIVDSDPHSQTTSSIGVPHISREGSGSGDSKHEERFVQSDNFYLKPVDNENSDNLSRSPSLRRLRESLRARFSFKKGDSKRQASSPHKNILTVPLLQSPVRTKRSESHSSTSFVPEEYHVQPKEGGRGNFVVIKIKEPGPNGFLDESYVKKLEENFRLNHMFGSLAVDVEEGMKNIIKQGQVYLQHLNYMSLAVQIDGVFSNMTLMATRRFQHAHNKHESKYSSSLKENGFLTSVTFQYLRQAFLTVYASMLRLGALHHLGESFDPTSTREEDVQAFRTCVSQYQETLSDHHTYNKGVLCASTIAAISERLVNHISKDTDSV